MSHAESLLRHDSRACEADYRSAFDRKRARSGSTTQAAPARPKHEPVARRRRLLLRLRKQASRRRRLSHWRRSSVWYSRPRNPRCVRLRRSTRAGVSSSALIEQTGSRGAYTARDDQIQRAGSGERLRPRSRFEHGDRYSMGASRKGEVRQAPQQPGTAPGDGHDGAVRRPHGRPRGRCGQCDQLGLPRSRPRTR